MPQEILKLKAPRIDFDRAGTDPLRWHAVAGHLRATARLVWVPIAAGMAGYGATKGEERSPAQVAALEEQVRHRGPFFLLAGLAIENQLKALIVAQALAAGQPLRTGHDVLGLLEPKDKRRKRKVHQLDQLADDHRIEITEAERALLKRLSGFVQWAGRYPIPKRESEASMERTTRECDLDEVERCMARLEGELLRAMVIVKRRQAQG